MDGESKSPFAGRRYGVFDLDGTVFRWSMMLYAIDLLSQEGKIPKHVLDESHRLRREWKRRETAIAYDRYIRHAVFAFEDQLGKGLTRADMMRVGQRVIDRQGDKVYVFTRSLLQALQESGYVTIALSHSSQELVDLFAEKWKFHIALGTVAHADAGGTYTGTRVLPAKFDELERLIAEHGLERAGSIGVGDTVGDVPMVLATDIPILFNPADAMVKSAMVETPKRRHPKATPPVIVTERKNVIWTRGLNPFRNYTTADLFYSDGFPFPLPEAVRRRTWTLIEEAGYGIY